MYHLMPTTNYTCPPSFYCNSSIYISYLHATEQSIPVHNNIVVSTFVRNCKSKLPKTRMYTYRIYDSTLSVRACVCTRIYIYKFIWTQMCVSYCIQARTKGEKVEKFAINLCYFKFCEQLAIVYISVCDVKVFHPGKQWLLSLHACMQVYSECKTLVDEISQNGIFSHSPFTS